MTDLVEIALITATASVSVGTIPGIMNWLMARDALRAAERAEAAAHATKAIAEATAKSVNGVVSKLVESVEKAGVARGVLQQKETGELIAHAVKEAQPPTVVIAQPQVIEKP